VCFAEAAPAEEPPPEEAQPEETQPPEGKKQGRFCIRMCLQYSKDDLNVSQGCVVMHLRSDDIFNTQLYSPFFCSK